MIENQNEKDNICTCHPALHFHTSMHWASKMINGFFTCPRLHFQVVSFIEEMFHTNGIVPWPGNGSI
jgi:hypothetical protein